MAGKVAVFYRGRVRRCQREGITVSQTKGCPSIGLSPMCVKRKLVPGSELWDLVVAYLHQGLSPVLGEQPLNCCVVAEI
jgi:hypothetical protein